MSGHGGLIAHDIYVERYIDGAWDSVSVDFDADDDRYPSITCEYWHGESDYLYISYEQIDPMFSDRDLMFAKSTDDGQNWQTQKLLGEADNYKYYQTSITTVYGKERMGNQDFIYIAYKVYHIARYNISVARSSDRGSSWEYRHVYEGNEEVNWPSIAATHGTGGALGGTVVVAWQIDAGDPQYEDIWYAWSPDNGDTWWLYELAGEQDVRELSPKLAVDGQDSSNTFVAGYIHIVYLQVPTSDVNHVDIAYQKVWYASPQDWSSVEIVNEEHNAIFPSPFDPFLNPVLTTQEREGDPFWERTYACVAWADSRNQATRGYDIYYSTPGATYTIAANPSTQGLKVQVDGVNWTNSRSFNWPAGYSHTINAPSPQREWDFGHYAFTTWNDGGDQSHSILVGTTDQTVTANYILQYKITFEINTVGPAHIDLNSTNYVTVTYRSSGAILNTHVWDASPAIVFVDKDSVAAYILVSSGSTATCRWYAPSNPSYTITNPATYNPTIWNQYKPLISAAVGGSGQDLDSTNYAELTYYRFGSAGTFNVFEGNEYNDWVDAGSTASLSNPSQESTPNHRWFSSGPVSWTINDASTRIATYYEQFKPEISVTTANTPKLNSTNYVTVSYIQNDNPKTYDIWDGAPFSDWCDIGSTATLSHPSSGSSSTERWDTEDPTSWTIDATHIIQVTFYHQYHLTVSSSYGIPGGAGWYQYVFTHWIGDTSGTDYSQSEPITMDAPKTAVANWKTQYYLTMNTDPIGLDDPRWSGWYDEDTYADIAVDTPTGGDGVSTRYRFDHWTSGIGIVDPTAPSTQIFMNGPKTATAYYVKQFKFTVTSDYDSPDPSVGDHWIDEDDSITASVTSPTDESDGTRYRCTGWTGTGSVPATGTDPSVTFNMTAPSTITWEWTPQYQITFTESGPEPGRPVTITVNGEPHSGTTIYNCSEWFDDGSSITFSITDPIDSATPGTRYVFVNWRNGAGSVITSPQTISAPDTFTAHYETQYQFQLTIDNGGHGITTPTTGNWYDAGEWVTITMGSDTTSNTTQTRYLFDSWTGTGTGNYSGSENPCQVQMNAPITEVAAETIEGYKFDHWDIDGTAQDPGTNPISPTMDAPYTATAHYVLPALPLGLVLGIVLIAMIATLVVTFLYMKRRRAQSKSPRKTPWYKFWRSLGCLT